MSNFDEALERLHGVDLEYAGGLANHGPMAVEALVGLGHQALIPAFVDVYAPRLPPFAPGSAFPPGTAESWLGDAGRAADWVATWERRLEGGDWRAVVAARVPSLLPGLFAAAGHGLLRTAHAVASLEREDTPLRRRELARGLATWSARFRPLPGLPGSRRSAGPSEPAAMLADWPLLAEPEARAGLLVRVVERLEDHAAFELAVERLTPPAEGAVGAWLGALCREAAGLYLAHPEARVAYVHTLTLPSALRRLLPYLPVEDHAPAAGFALQAVGALHSIFGERRAPRPREALSEEVQRIAGDWDEIRYHAACSLEEHAIKMTEACWREDRETPDERLRLAAADAALEIQSRGVASVC